jgi:hypothetical protein
LAAFCSVVANSSQQKKPGACFSTCAIGGSIQETAAVRCKFPVTAGDFG